MPVSTQDPERTLLPDEFKDVAGRFASGVTVITAIHDDIRLGATASAVSSLSLEPPMLLICLNRGSASGQAIAEVGRFAVNVLGEEHSELAVRFASRAPDRFAGVKVVQGLGGIPLLAEALATIECRVVETVIGGTHFVFLAEVEGASVRAGPPLAYFRGQFGRLELRAQDAGAAREIRERVLHRASQLASRSTSIDWRQKCSRHGARCTTLCPSSSAKG